MAATHHATAHSALQFAGAHRRTVIAGLTLMLLLHGAIAAMLFGASPAPRANPVRTAVAATLLSGPAQPTEQAPRQNMTEPVVEPTQQAELPTEHPKEQRPKEQRPKEQRPKEPRTQDQRPKHHERSSNPDSATRVASANPTVSASSSAAAAPASREPGSAASANASAPAAAIAPGAHCKTPEYPKASRRQNEEGVVSLRFLVDSDGRVLNAEVEKSSGYSRLDDAARNALALCQFRPGERDGQPVRSWARINYSWKLR